MRNPASVIIAVCASLTFFGSLAYACSCVQATPGEAVKNSDAVFVGLLQNSRHSPNPVRGVLGGGTIDATFKVIRAIKGVRNDQVVVVKTPDLGPFCGIEEWLKEKPGAEWVIYAGLPKDASINTTVPGTTYVTSRCDRSAQTRAAEEDLKYFDSLKVNR
jgi:hypothetical protein